MFFINDIYSIIYNLGFNRCLNIRKFNILFGCLLYKLR